MERYLEDPLAEELLRGKLDRTDIIDVGAGDEQLKFSAKAPAKKAAEKS